MSRKQHPLSFSMGKRYSTSASTAKPSVWIQKKNSHFHIFPKSRGAKLNQGKKRAYAQIPLVTDESSATIVHEMLRNLLQECFKRQSVESFGCCNDHVRCSDAKCCLHADDKFYLGCIYRKNLEEGHIFYGKNRNVEDTL